MSTQELIEKINYYTGLTKTFISDNPEASDISWIIENIPYNVFEEVRKELGTRAGEARQSSKRLTCLIYSFSNSGAGISLYTVPLVIKTTIEVINEEAV